MIHKLPMFKSGTHLVLFILVIAVVLCVIPIVWANLHNETMITTVMSIFSGAMSVVMTFHFVQKGQQNPNTMSANITTPIDSKIPSDV